jgi:hypothetical protein
VPILNQGTLLFYFVLRCLPPPFYFGSIVTLKPGQPLKQPMWRMPVRKEKKTFADLGASSQTGPSQHQASEQAASAHARVVYGQKFDRIANNPRVALQMVGMLVRQPGLPTSSQCAAYAHRGKITLRIPIVAATEFRVSGLSSLQRAT